MKYNLITLCACLLAIMPTPSKADMASNMCRSYMSVIEQSIVLRDAGVPIQHATDMARSAFNLNRNLHAFVVAAIRHSYSDPHDARRQIRNGRFQEICEREVRGY